MHESIAHIAEQLKQARAAKGLSQRALSAKAGIPQSHISKIESGAVNLQLSSLIELSRVLGLEMMLVPQKAAPAAKSLVWSAEKDKYQLATEKRKRRQDIRMAIEEVEERNSQKNTKYNAFKQAPKNRRKYQFEEEEEE